MQGSDVTTIPAGYTYRPPRLNADGSKNGFHAFRDSLMETLRTATAESGRLAALQDEVQAKYAEFKQAVDPLDEGKSFTWYYVEPEALMLEYDFVPAWQGVPAEPDPFTVYYDLDGEREGNVAHHLPTTIPVFEGQMRGTVHPDGAIRLSGSVAGYFVKKGSLATSVEFSVVKIAGQGTLTIEQLRDRLFEYFMRTIDSESEVGEEAVPEEREEQAKTDSRFEDEMNFLEVSAPMIGS